MRYLMIILIVVAVVALFWALKALLGAVRFRRLLLRLSLLVLASVLALGLGEIGVRWLLRDVSSTGDSASWFSRRWDRTLRTNGAGYRDAEFELHAAPGAYRIAVIGDSLTYGQGIEEERRFTERVEAGLNAQGGGHRFEVLNFGLPGSETVDHLQALQQVIESSRPDFVLLQWYRNDIEGVDKSGRPQPLPLAPSGRVSGWLGRRSALYYLLNVRWADVQGRIGLVGSYEDYIIQRFGDPQSADWKQADALLRDFAARLRKAGIPGGIVLFRKLTPLNPLRFLHERVMAICDDEDLFCLDLDPVYAAIPEPHTLWANPLDPHPGPEAHRIAAEAILERFGPVWESLAEADGAGSATAGKP